MALTKDLDLFSAVRTFHVAVVLHDSKDRNLHHISHVIGLLDDHADQILRRSNDHDTLNRQGLEYCQRNISGSWRHIYKEIIQFTPDHITPELFYHICKDRTSPNHRCLLIRKKKVYRHNLDSVCSWHRIDSVVTALCVTLDAIHLRDGRACDIRIHNAHFISLGSHQVCQGACYKGFTDATLSANNSDHMFYVRKNVWFCHEALGLFLSAAFTA